VGFCALIIVGVKKKSLNYKINEVQNKIQYEKGSLEVLQEQYESAISFDYHGSYKTTGKVVR